jgi:uncharacterized FlaG/YvyC family protein
MLENITKLTGIKSHILLSQPNHISTKIENKQMDKSLELSNDDKKILKDIVKGLNSLPDNQLEFGFNDEHNIPTISVFERKSHRLIREFPSKEFFDRLTYFRDNILPGLLFDKSV